MAKLSDLHNAIVKGNLELAVSTTQEALQENIDPQTLISDYLIKGMEEIGTQFEAGKAYVPNLLMSARAMKGALELLKPYMENDKNTISLGKVVIGTVKGDLHDIGKNLVSSMLEGCGFEVKIRRSRQRTQSEHCLYVGTSDYHNGLYERSYQSF